jgi:hypothetical protein
MVRLHFHNSVLTKITRFTRTCHRPLSSIFSSVYHYYLIITGKNTYHHTTGMKISMKQINNKKLQKSQQTKRYQYCNGWKHMLPTTSKKLPHADLRMDLEFQFKIHLHFMPFFDSPLRCFETNKKYGCS